MSQPTECGRVRQEGGTRAAQRLSRATAAATEDTQGQKTPSVHSSPKTLRQQHKQQQHKH